MFSWQEDDKIQSKLITPEAAFLAFKEGHQHDTGWLPAGVLRADVATGLRHGGTRWSFVYEP